MGDKEPRLFRVIEAQCLVLIRRIYDTLSFSGQRFPRDCNRPRFPIEKENRLRVGTIPNIGVCRFLHSLSSLALAQS